MGVTITDTITLDNGLTVSNAYASFGLKDVRLEKRLHTTPEGVPLNGVEKYYVIGQLNFWATKAIRDQDRNTIKTEYITRELTLSQVDAINTNLYKYLYDNVVKTTYNATDDI